MPAIRCRFRYTSGPREGREVEVGPAKVQELMEDHEMEPVSKEDEKTYKAFLKGETPKVEGVDYSVLEGTNTEVGEAVQKVHDRDTLKELFAAEKRGQNRKGAKAAIQQRLKDLA